MKEELNSTQPPSGMLEHTVRGWLSGVDAVERGTVESFVPATDLGETHANKGVLVTKANASHVREGILAKFGSIVPDLLSVPDEGEKAS